MALHRSPKILKTFFYLSKTNLWLQSANESSSIPRKLYYGMTSKSSNEALIDYSQENLPHLPVPELNTTLEKYLESVRPLVSINDFEKTKKIVDIFRTPGGVGSFLQQRLEQRAKEAKTSWLEEWWNDLAYFGYRDPVVVNVNYFYHFCDDPLRPSQLERAASLVYAAMKFRELILKNQLAPDVLNNEQACMYQYQYMFNTCRTPMPQKDALKKYDPLSNRHLVVMKNGQFYQFDVIDETGNILSMRDIERQLAYISNTPCDPGHSIGILTTEHRDNWTEARRQLLTGSENNAKSLELIQAAVFVLCLDEESPTSLNDVARGLWHANGVNRFFDKSFQLIVFKNGKAGLNGEHSGMDGLPTLRLSDYMLKNLLVDAKWNQFPEQSVVALSKPQHIPFDINDSVKNSIQSALKHFDILIQEQELHAVQFKAFGKSEIKKFGLSPDSFVQMAIQLAYYKMTGTTKATYESAQTRKYFHGRTETVRSASLPSKLFTKTMSSSASSYEKFESLKNAISHHVKLMKAATNGQGIDRHLLGLKLLLEPNESREFFDDKSFAESSHWYLSTSQMTCEHFENKGWGEVVPDGFGVGYMIKDNSLHFNITSKRLGSIVLGNLICESLENMKDICQQVCTPANKL